MNSAHRYLLLASFLALQSRGGASQELQKWFLMARHGDCVEINKALRRKIPDLPGITSPDEFIREMEHRRIKIKVKKNLANKGIVLVDVPQYEMSLIFANEDACRRAAASN